MISKCQWRGCHFPPISIVSLVFYESQSGLSKVIDCPSCIWNSEGKIPIIVPLDQCLSTDFALRTGWHYFHGPAFKVWQINESKTKYNFLISCKFIVTLHNVESAGALSLFLCNKLVDIDTRRVFLTSSLLRDIVLVAVNAENPASRRHFVLCKNVSFLCGPVRNASQTSTGPWTRWLPTPILDH